MGRNMKKQNEYPNQETKHMHLSQSITVKTCFTEQSRLWKTNKKMLEGKLIRYHCHPVIAG